MKKGCSQSLNPVWHQKVQTGKGLKSAGHVLSPGQPNLNIEALRADFMSEPTIEYHSSKHAHWSRMRIADILLLLRG